MKVAIHQPNFIPWLGLFDRISRVDRFVLFDHVQAMRGKSWLTRNHLLLSGESRWFTVPVHRSGEGLPLVSEVRIDYDGRFPAKHLRTLEMEYGRHPHFAEIGALVEAVFTAGHELVADLNSDFIRRVTDLMGLRVGFVTSSSLIADEPDLAHLAGNELVVRTCLAAGGTEYLSGDGCHDFIEPASFGAEGVTFRFQEYRHPTYPQHGRRDFVTNLSVVDALANLGGAGVAALFGHPPENSDGPTER